MACIDVVAVKKAVKDGALVTKVVDGNILLADVKSGEAAKVGELPVGVGFLPKNIARLSTQIFRGQPVRPVGNIGLTLHPLSKNQTTALSAVRG